MSYEIPQKIEYKEKILFGLTFGQLFYVLIFSPIALAILFKLPLELPYRIALALIPSGLAGVFMFTPIPKMLLSWVKWLRCREFPEDKMKAYLGIEKIEGGILYLK